MKNFSFLRLSVLLVIFSFLPHFLYSQETTYGDSASLGNGTIKAWVKTDASNNPQSIGLTLTEGVLTNLPETGSMTHLNLPKNASDTLFNHILFDWNPMGHPPIGIYTLPHFDLHFYIISKEEREAIPGGPDLIKVEPRFVPPDYVGDPSGVPQMGTHWTDTTASEFHGNVFDKTFIYGYAKGKFSFHEQMFTTAYLETHPHFSESIKQPAEFQKEGYYPTTYKIDYDSLNHIYNIEITDFVWHQAAAPLILSDGLTLWLKADAGVTLNGSTVSSWIDQSGSGNDVIQVNTSRQPLLLAGSLNGKPVLRFDGLNDKLGFTGSTVMTQFSLFLVINNHQGTVGNTGNVITFGANGDFSHQWYMGMAIPEFGSENLGMSEAGDGWVRGSKPGLVAYDQWRNLSVVTTGTIWNTTLQWDGNNIPMVPGGINNPISVPLGNVTGSGGGIGGADGVPVGTILAKCDVAEMIVYNRAVTDSERLAVENYLADKYNLTNTSIPTDSLQLWLKADAGVTLNGSTVSSWIDQSGKGNNALQSTTNRQPLLVNNALNDKPVLHFDGINDRLALTGSTTMSQISLFLVFKIDSGLIGNIGTDPLPYYPILLNGYGLSMRNFFSSNSPNLIDPFVGEDSWVHAQAPNIAAYNQWKVLNVVANQTMWNTTVRSNGVDAVITPQGTSSAPLSVSLGRLDGSDGIGGADNVPVGHLIFKGDIAEVVIYNKILSDSERVAVENYLADKYNITIVTGIEDSKEKIIPERFTLSQNYPNPFNPSTTIKFQVPNASFVNLKVYDVLGKEVATLVNEEKPVGNYEVNFSASQLSSGIYFYKLQAGKFVETKKMILLK